MLFQSFVGTFGNLSVHVSRQASQLYRQIIWSTDKILKEIALLVYVKMPASAILAAISRNTFLFLTVPSSCHWTSLSDHRFRKKTTLLSSHQCSISVPQDAEVLRCVHYDFQETPYKVAHLCCHKFHLSLQDCLAYDWWWAHLLEFFLIMCLSCWLRGNVMKKLPSFLFRNMLNVSTTISKQFESSKRSHFISYN